MPERPRTAPGPEPTGRGDWWLSGPLTALLLGLGLTQLALWVPHYLTWPYWADHDVFATAARAWTEGRLPYRDTRLNNFPGTLYLFAALGALFGWGRPGVFYASDALGLVAFLGLLIAWSRRQFGTALPGVVGALTFQSIYLGLDYAHAGQRDWQGPALMVAGLLLTQGWPGPRARVVAGLAAAVALSVRPQTALLLPAAWLSALTEPEAKSGTVRATLDWGLALALGLALAFAPLAVAGVLGEFVASVRLVAYGSRYNQVGLGGVARNWALQAATWRWWAVPIGLVLLARPGTRRVAGPWLLALAGVSLYKPVSPVPHSYLDIPLALVWSISLAALVGVALGRADVPGAFRLAVVVLGLGLGTTQIRPDFCVPGPSWRAIKAALRGQESAEPPPGYRHGTVATSAFYPWEDYRALLDHLRRRTGPTTRVANLLKGDPAVTAMVDRLSAFPAESVAWLRMVRPEDEAAFARALEASADSVVVWVPGEVGPDPAFQTEQLAAVVRARYEPSARFGALELWVRRPVSGWDVDTPAPRTPGGPGAK